MRREATTIICTIARDPLLFALSLFTLCFLLFALCLPAQAQQAGKPYRIGFLSTSSARTPSRGMRAVQRELIQFGYVEGKDIVFVQRYGEERPERTIAMAEELVRLKVDVIVGGGAGDAQAAKNATKTIPIIFMESIADPITVGLVSSLAHPGGNVTGFTTLADVLAGKRLELLKETLPKISRVTVLWDPNGENEAQWRESQEAGQKLGVQLYSMQVRRADQYDGAFKEAKNARSSALAVTRTRLANVNQKRIVDLAAKHGLPAIYYRESFVENGGLMTYGANEVEPFKRIAVMVDKILKGAKPSDIPVEQPTKFEFIVNLKTARQLRLEIPPLSWSTRF